MCDDTPRNEKISGHRQMLLMYTKQLVKDTRIVTVGLKDTLMCCYLFWGRTVTAILGNLQSAE